MYQNIQLIIVNEQNEQEVEFGNFAPVLNAAEELIRNGTLKAFRLGTRKAMRYKKADLIKFIEKSN